MLSIYEASQATARKRGDEAPSIGLAMAGGGPVGAVYELGALRALEESIDGLQLHQLDVYVGVSAGAFIAASLANGISCTEQCRIFMGTQHAALKFVPELFLRPAYREYFERAMKVPGVARDALMRIIRHPTTATPSELITELGKALPSGIYNNETIHSFLEHSFEEHGVGNRFDDLHCKLYVVAVDLDSGKSVRFGSEEYRDVPISRAVQASAALPGLYPPVRIGDRYYVDGALRRTLHASVALDEGIDFLIGINPLVPYDADSSEEARELPLAALIHGGLPLILSQTFRALIQSRMQVGFKKYRTSHPTADLLLIEPERDDQELFFTNVFSYASRTALCEHAYQVTRKDLRRQADQLEPLLEPYGLSLNRERLDDEERCLLDSINHDLTGHARVGRDLSTVLDELEESLHEIS
ncbi:MAG: patatin-like phospholipase family protein [Xanthomonadales bacterium]|jgi:predicted acylesterase/phospholipase RssA|nr:patatin-like phospholipase family protein [Xanthomonadales bacterium]